MRSWTHFTLIYRFHLQISCKCIKNFTAIVFVHKIIMQQLSTADIDTFRCPFVHCTGTENIYSWCQTSAAAEASYDGVHSLALYLDQNLWDYRNMALWLNIWFMPFMVFCFTQKIEGDCSIFERIYVSELIGNLFAFIIRSTSKSRPNNIEGRNVRPPVRPSVHKKFLQFEWNLVYR